MTPTIPLRQAGPPTPANFPALARETLEFLKALLGFETWVIASAQDNDWILVGDDAAHHTALRSLCALADTGARIVHDARAARHTPPLTTPLDERIGAYLHLPLTAPDAAPLGALCAVAPTAISKPADEHMRLLMQTARTLSGAWHLERQRLAAAHEAARLRAESETDVLTGLPNRRAWNRHLIREEARCRRYGDPAAVIMVDLDGLKTINDQQGHPAGDRVLNRAAVAIAKAVRSCDMSARVGGDEFAVLLTCADEATADMVKLRIEINLKHERIEASIGYARRDRQTTTLQNTVAAADTAMYQAKRTRYRQHDAAHRSTAPKRHPASPPNPPRRSA